MSLCSFVSVYSGESIAGKTKGEMSFSKGFSVCRHRFHKVSEDQFVPFVAVKRESRVLFGRSKPLRRRGGGWRSQQAKKSAAGVFVTVVAEWCFRGHFGRLFISLGLFLMSYTDCNG